MSDLARQLIEKNKRTRATSLDLSNCGLKKIPAEITDLIWLEVLSLHAYRAEWDGQKFAYLKTNNQGPANSPLDLRPLAGLPNLLALSVNRPRRLSALVTLPALKSLVIEGISSLKGIESLSALQSLNLWNTQVSDLTPLVPLTNLQTLNLWRTRVSDLTPLAPLTSLQSLNISNTLVSDLTPLTPLTALQSLNISNTEVSDLSPLAPLTNLQRLHLYRTLVSDLAPLARLTRLQWLHLYRTLASDLTPLASLTALHSLDLQETQVSDLTPLAPLTALQWLDISFTLVSDLTPLAPLTALQSLNLAVTQVNDLTPILPLIRKGLRLVAGEYSLAAPGIFVTGCPLTIPPPEIVDQGNEAILNYFRELESAGTDHLYEAKMLILGEGGAGKTSLYRRLFEPDLGLPTEKETTHGIDVHVHHFPLPNGRRFRLNVWDFGGQEIYHATHQFFLTQRSLYVLVDDTRKDHKSVSDPGFKNWLELIEVFGGHSPVLIFQNEKDNRSKAIDLPGIKGRFDNVKELESGNLEHLGAADLLRDQIEFLASHLPHIGEELPARWIDVRQGVEELAAQTPYARVQDYFDIYARHIEFDRAKALHLSRYLHDLGVFLHFQDDPLLARTVILQNGWATRAVYCLLDDELVKSRLGRFTRADCVRLWSASEYEQMHPELLALMERFELCYPLRDSEPRTWLIPQLLPPSKPGSLQEWGKPADLVLRYRYQFLPKGILSRLTVRLHRFVQDPQLAWTTGALFEREGSQLLAELLPSGLEVELRARGHERKALLSVISSDLDALNDSFKGLKDKVDLLVPCLCAKCSAARTPHFYERKDLLLRKERNRRTVECKNSYEDVDVHELLEGIRSPELPAWAAPRTIRIFLASSAELKDDRDAFDLYFQRQNNQLKDKGIYLEIDRWEYFFDAMSESRLQDEYNKKVAACDVFVALFFTKAGAFTVEEFNVAYDRFKSSGRPLIYTYCKDAQITTGSARREDLQSLWAFQDQLKVLGHYPTPYENTEHLKRHFRDQLNDILRRLPT